MSFYGQFSLREKKQAKTKVFLAKEFLESLKNAKYEDVSIRSICEKVEVSEGTFYNYFPQKTDMLNFVISMYGTRKSWITNKEVSQDDPIKWLHAYFANAVDMFIDLGNLSNEIFASIVREKIIPQKINISRLELFYMFPDMEGEADLQQVFSTDDIFEDIVKNICEKGLVKDDVTEEALTVAFKLLLGGITLVTAMHEINDVKDIVQKQLDILLRGVMK